MEVAAARRNVPAEQGRDARKILVADQVPVGSEPGHDAIDMDGVP